MYYSATYYTLSGKRLSDFDRDVTLDYIRGASFARALTYVRAEPSGSIGSSVWFLDGVQVPAPTFAVRTETPAAELCAQELANLRARFK